MLFTDCGVHNISNALLRKDFDKFLCPTNAGGDKDVNNNLFHNK